MVIPGKKSGERLQDHWSSGCIVTSDVLDAILNFLKWLKDDKVVSSVKVEGLCFPHM